MESVKREIFEKVCEQVSSLGAARCDPTRIGEGARLIEDIGLDSLKFIDLTVRIEAVFGLREFPMQDWVDDQIAAGRPLTVGELARACEAMLS